jgi:hypothetical protein
MNRGDKKMFRELFLCAMAVSATAEEAVPPFATQNFAPGRKVRIEIHSGDVKIVRGSDLDHIVVRLAGPDSVSFGHRGNDDVSIRIPEAAHLRAVIELPSPSALTVRMLGGQLTVEGIDANQDLDNSVGDITVTGPEKGYLQMYRNIQASVGVGGVDGLGFEKFGGWFGLTRQVGGQGPYSLRAHVNVGHIHFLPVN